MYFKPCTKCKGSRKGVNYCIRMGHAPQSDHKHVFVDEPGAKQVKHEDGGEYLKPCARCKGSRKGVSYCIRMGHTPLSAYAEDKMEEEAAAEEEEDDDEVEDAEEDEQEERRGHGKDKVLGLDGSEYLKPCSKCKASRKGVAYCIRMGHDPHIEDEEAVSLAERRAAKEGGAPIRVFCVGVLWACVRACCARRKIWSCSVLACECSKKSAVLEKICNQNICMLQKSAVRARAKRCTTYAVVRLTQSRSCADEEGLLLKPCVRCKGSRKGVKYCTGMGHAPQAEDDDEGLGGFSFTTPSPPPQDRAEKAGDEMSNYCTRMGHVPQSELDVEEEAQEEEEECDAAAAPAAEDSTPGKYKDSDMGVALKVGVCVGD